MPTLTTNSYNVLFQAVAKAHDVANQMNTKRPNDPLVDQLLNLISSIEKQVLNIKRDAPPL